MPDDLKSLIANLGLRVFLALSDFLEKNLKPIWVILIVRVALFEAPSDIFATLVVMNFS